jgi:hypothetical protein
MTITALPPAPSRNTPSTFSALADAWVAALGLFVTEANATAAAMNLNDTTATSSTSLAIGTGAKSLTVDASKSYQVGMSVKIAHDSTNWMHGEVTSYNSGTGALVVNVTSTMGSGTETSWTVTFSSPTASYLLTTAYAADTGAADAYVVTLSPALAAHVVGLPVRFKATNANTGASTVNINGLGAIAIKKNVSTALAAGDIAAGQIVEVVYDGTYYQLISLPSFKKSFTQDDYYRLPGGLMIQWKYINGGGVPWSSKAVTFPYAFPNACLGVHALETNTSSAHAFSSTSITASGCYVYAGGTAANYDVFVLIIGW